MTTKSLNNAKNMKLMGKILSSDNDERLISKNIFVHKDVNDDDLDYFISKCFYTHIKDDKNCSIPLMNNNCICFKWDNDYYLMNATISSLSIDNETRTAKVWANYTDVKKEDFIALQ